jgi:cytochrome P450
MIVGEVIEYCAAVYEDRLAHPQDDIPTLIANLQVLGQRVTEDEFLRTMLALFVAGLDTTVSAGAHILEYLAEHPERRAELVAEPESLSTAIEEFVRYISPVPSLRRRTTRAAEVHGCPIAKDTDVLLFWMAANHDPAEFEDPDKVDFRRFPNRHVAFGAGIHRCLGAHVARQELSVLVGQVLTRLDDLRLDPERPVARYEGTTRGIESLDLTFTPGTRVAG